jgi:hypothetical protein
MRWGNWDNVTNGVRWQSSEVPSAIPNYPNTVPPNQNLPASLYLNAQPSFWNTPWGTPKWPPIGPDVVGGNITNSPTGGHADKIPARLCFEHMSDHPDYPAGTVKLFDANACYISAGGSAPAPPTGLSSSVQ